jgi:hypothetical protein
MQLDLPQIDGGTLLVEEDGCTIRHPEPGALLGVIQSQQPFTLAAAAASAAKQKQKQQCAYFEVEVLEVGCSPDTQSSGVACVAIGLAPGGYPSDCLPGWLEGSVGYHGDDGRLYLEQDNGGQPFGPLVVKGDIVGCGIDSVNQRVFFTRNGLFLKEAVSGDWVGRQPYYPTVGVGGDSGGGGEVVRVNFGSRRFAYDPYAAMV